MQVAVNMMIALVSQDRLPAGMLASPAMSEILTAQWQYCLFTPRFRRTERNGGIGESAGFQCERSCVQSNDLQNVYLSQLKGGFEPKCDIQIEESFILIIFDYVLILHIYKYGVYELYAYICIVI